MHHPFADMIDLKVEAKRAGHSVLSLTLAPQHLNPHGVVHGAVVFALADTGMGSALYPMLAPGQICATIDIAISYFRPVQAGRLMLSELERHFQAGSSFAFETTLSGRAYLRHIARWQQAGYEVKLIFLRLSSAEEAVARVAQRVRQGGHDIPPEVIRRRFVAGLENFQRYYAPAVDVWALYDNAGEVPVLLDWSER